MIRHATPADAGVLAARWNPRIADTANTFAATLKTSADIARMIAAISAENPAAIRFHARQRYHQTALIRDTGCKFGRFIAIVLMQKFLT